MPTESNRSLIKIGDSTAVTLDPDWLRYWEKHFAKHGKKVKVLGNSMLIIIPQGKPELEEKARRIVEGRD